MSKVQEIESALRELPPQQKWEVACWLLDELDGGTEGQAEVSITHSESALPIPDYAARRRRIFGDKVLPNMVLVSRAEERW